MMVQDREGNLLGYVNTKYGPRAASDYVGSSQETADAWLRENYGMTINVVLGGNRTAAYKALFFCTTRSTLAAEFAAEFRNAMSDRREKISFGSEPVGESWMAFDIWAAGSAERINLAFHLGGQVFELETGRASKEPGNLTADTNALIKTILSGEVDWELFQVVWRVAAERFSGIPYDETDGFRVSL